MKPIDFFDQLDQAHEAGAGFLMGDAHAALGLAQRLRRVSCLAESAGRLARIVPGGAASERRVFARGRHKAHRQAVLRNHFFQRPKRRGRAFLLDQKRRIDRPVASPRVTIRSLAGSPSSQACREPS
jgi:hypothetical protein